MIILKSTARQAVKNLSNEIEVLRDDRDFWIDEYHKCLDNLGQLKQEFDQLQSDRQVLLEALESVTLNYEQEHLNMTSVNKCGDKAFEAIAKVTR